VKCTFHVASTWRAREPPHAALPHHQVRSAAVEAAAALLASSLASEDLSATHTAPGGASPETEEALAAVKDALTTLSGPAEKSAPIRAAAGRVLTQLQAALAGDRGETGAMVEG